MGHVQTGADRERRVLVFTDLDGTLLELDTYSFTKSAPALRKLRARGIPVIFCSSKTRAEQEYYRERLGVGDPFVTENGSAVYCPLEPFRHLIPGKPDVAGMWVHVLGVPADRIRERLRKVCGELGIRCKGYGDMTLPEIVEITGLKEHEASLAADREYSETLLEVESGVDDILLSKLTDRLSEEGLRGMRGSRYYTVTGLGANKGSAVKRLIEAYRIASPDVVSIGIGDAANDEPMLAAVEYPVLVRRPDGTWADVDIENLKRMNGVGPEGWIEAAELLSSSFL